MPLPAKMPTAANPSENGPVPIAAAPVEHLLHISSREVPPGGLWYRIIPLAERAPQSAVVGPYNDSDTLTKEVNLRERANGLPISTLAQVENQNCQRLPPGYCRDSKGYTTKHPGSSAMGLSDVIHGTRALVNWFKHGSVDTGEIERRTRICNACPENVPIAGCQGCAANALYSVMNAIVVKPLPSDAVLGACSICKCSLRAKTRMRLEDLPPLSPEQRARLPQACWLNPDAEPTRNDPRI